MQDGAKGPGINDVWAVVLNYRGWADTRTCLASMAGEVADGLRVILVDNGGDEVEAETVRHQFPWCTVLVNRENLGFSAGNNVGIVHALERGAQWILLLNNDMVVLPGLSRALLAAGSQGFDIVGPGVNYMEEPDVRMDTAFSFCPPDFQDVFRPVDVPGGHVLPVDVVMGCAMFVSRRAWETVGLMHGAYFLQHEETDYCLIAASYGMKVGALGTVLARHKGRSSFRREGLARYYYYDVRNLFLLYRRIRRRASLRAAARQMLGRTLTYARIQYLRAMKEDRPADARAVARAVWDGTTARFGPMTAGPHAVSTFVAGLALDRGGRILLPLERWLTR